jgi:hypothetical protein
MMSAFEPIYDFLHSPLGMALLLAALLFGLWNMYRQPATNLSQRLMRWRVGLQFAVIILLLGLAFFPH